MSSEQFTDAEVAELWDSARDELRDLEAELRHKGSVITAGQLEMAVDLADEAAAARRAKQEPTRDELAAKLERIAGGDYSPELLREWRDNVIARAVRAGMENGEKFAEWFEKTARSHRVLQALEAWLRLHDLHFALVSEVIGEGEIVARLESDVLCGNPTVHAHEVGAHLVDALERALEAAARKVGT